MPAVELGNNIQFNRYKATVRLYCGAESTNNNLSTNLYAKSLYRSAIKTLVT